MIDLEGLPDEPVPGRDARGVRLGAYLDRLGVPAGARHVRVVSTDGMFAASLPLDGARECLLARLPPDKGGPIRLVVPDPAKLGVDACANVKDVGSIELLEAPGRSTCAHSQR
jgi:DMSO/TMAO reductase YedYZ molybdopterin-dependent catalytic subunit